MKKNCQENRWSKVLNQWAGVQKGPEVLAVGDMNLDFFTWNYPERGHKKMVNETKDKIESAGFAQLVKGPTRFWKNTHPSLIDQVWSNSPDKIIHCKNIARPVANHNIVEMLVRMKGNPRTNMEILKRRWRYFNQEVFKNRIKDIDWKDIYQIKNADLAYNFLEEKMT